jgi:hypothetical protein
VQELELEMPDLKKAVRSEDEAALRDMKAHMDGIRERLGKARDEAPNVPPGIDKAVEDAWANARATADLVPDSVAATG